MKQKSVNVKRKFNTHDIADLAILQYKDEIAEIWSSMNHHEAFVEFREIAKRIVMRQFGKATLNKLSNQFIGYAAHYIYAYCTSKSRGE